MGGGVGERVWIDSWTDGKATDGTLDNTLRIVVVEESGERGVALQLALLAVLAVLAVLQCVVCGVVCLVWCM